MMEPNPTADDGQTIDGSEEFDRAVADCIVRLESGRNVDEDWLKANYPGWHRELAQFIADWDAVENYSSEIRSVGITAVAASTDVPDVIGEYKILEQIGSGGMGVIYKALQPSLSRAVAIKMLHNVRHDRRRFQMEAEAAARLDHPNIVTILDVGEHEGNPYFTMPFIDGDDLSKIVQREKLAPRRASKIAATIADAVHYAHQRGILHRDLKPGNILLDDDDQPHVTDFGLAKRIEGTDQLTRTNAIIGTPSYMAPEQALGNNKEVSVATDVYGVGAILYAMLTGSAPFSGSSSMEILRQVVDTNPRGLDSSIVTQDLKVICEKCLDKCPARRYGSADELSEDLKRHLSGEPIQARPLGKLSTALRWVRRNPVVASLGTATAAMLLFGLVSWALLWRSESDARRAAEAGTRRERRLNAEIQGAFERENAARQRAELTLSDAYTNYGYAAQQQDRPNEAFLWFCHAERASPKQRVKANRRRVAAWMKRIPLPIFAHHEPTLTVAKFDPSSRWLLCSRSNQKVFRVFDLHSGKPIALDFEGKATSVKWGSNAGILWFGTDQGAVVRLDCKSGALDQVTRVSAEVNCLGESTDGLLLAVGFEDRIAVYDQQAKSLRDHTHRFPAWVIDAQFCCENQDAVVTCNNQRVYKQSLQASVQEAEPWASDEVALEVPFDLRSKVYTSPEKRQTFYPTVYDDDKLALLKISKETTNATTRLCVYELNRNKLIHTCTLGISYANSLPNSRGEVLNCGDRHARIRTLENGAHTERILHGRYVTRCDMSPDGNLVATADWRNVHVTERTETRRLFRESHDIKPPFSTIPHRTRVSHVSFSPDSRLLVTVQFDGLIRVWDVASARQPKIDLAVEEEGSRAIFARGPRGILTGNHHRDGQVHSFREINLDSGTTQDLVESFDGQLRDVAYAADGIHFAMAVAEGVVESGYVLIKQDPNNRHGGDTTIRVPLDADPRSIAAHPHKHQYAVLCGNGDAVVINGQTGEIDGERQIPEDAMTAPIRLMHNGQVAYSADGCSLVLLGNEWSSGLRVLDADGLQQRFPTFKNNGDLIHHCDVSPVDSVVAVAGGRSNKVSILAIDTGKPVAEPLEHPAAVYFVRFSIDGSRIVTACRDGQARIYDWKTGQILGPALEHESDVIQACFTDSGKMVVTISRDKLAKLWNADTGLQVCPPIFVGDGMRYLETDSLSQLALVSGRVPKAVIIDLSQPRSLDSADGDTAYLLAELTAQATIMNAGVVPLTTDDWAERWNRYRKTRLFATHAKRLFLQPTKPHAIDMGVGGQRGDTNHTGMAQKAL